jgi:hypothetical protein
VPDNSTNIPDSENDNNCKTIVLKKCTECYLRWYVDTKTGICAKVSDYCRTWNKVSGICTGCYGGY